MRFTGASFCGWHFRSLLILAMAAFLEAKVHPVDLTSFMENGTPDPYRTSDPAYFHQWLREQVNPVATAIFNAQQLSYYEFTVNITQENGDAIAEQTEYTLNASGLVSERIKAFDVSKMDDEVLQMAYNSLSQTDPDPETLAEVLSIVNFMSTVQATATVCFDPSKTVQELEKLAESGCPEELQITFDPALNSYMNSVFNDTGLRKYAWKAWMDATGKVIRDSYTRYIDAKNTVARRFGLPDNGAVWRGAYTVRTLSLNYTDAEFLDDLEGLWQQLRPLYLQLHAFVRRKIILKFPNEQVSPTGPIPAHLLGDMYSEQWTGMLSLLEPFPSKPLLDVSAEMRAQNYTVEQMFRTSEKFQTDLGLMPMPESFWNLSMLTNPNDRPVNCHPTSWDLFSSKPPYDVRIAMCAEVDFLNFIIVHHEMGHIQYFLQYANQSLVFFRDGANAGFHEAVGDTLALSVRTPKHLAWLGLLKNNTDDAESDLNYLFATATEKIAFLPYAYIVDKYRYDVFSGKISKENLNAGWWKYVTDYQGITPPVPRTEADFDAGAKYHVAADVEYMRYFIAYILQFQFHKALCTASGWTGPLYRCDINQSKAAGKLLSDMLSLGASQPWPVVLQKMTGSSKMDAAPILEFFEPLLKFLQDSNAKNGDTVGWSSY